MKQEILQSIKKEWSTIKKGFLITEVLLSSALFIAIVTAFVGVYFYGQESTLSAGNHTRAVILANEGLEAVRNIRDSGFSNLPIGTYGLVLSGNQWTLSGSQDVSGIFTRRIIISSVDSNRKNIAINVTWQQNPQSVGTVSLSTRVTNWIASGTGAGGGGGGGGGYATGDWSAPQITSTTTLVGADNGGDKIQVDGNYAYVISSGNDKNFFIVDVSTSTTPSIKSSLSLPGNPQNIFVFGNYVYVASDKDDKELQIVNVTNKSSPSLVGSYNAPGNADAKGIYVVDNIAYLVRANSSSDEFIEINVSTSSSPTLISSLNLSATGYEVVVSGNYAYVAGDNNTQELQVINITNKASPSLAGSLNLSLSEQNRSSSIALAGSKLYLGEGKNFYIISVATETAPTLLASVPVPDYLNDLAINLGKSDTYLYLATSDIAKELKIYNVASSTAPALLGAYDLSGSNQLYGIAYNPVVDRAYAVSHSTTQGLVIFSSKP